MKDKLKRVVENNPKKIKILKDDHRSLVYTFSFENRIYVYKEPKEKNRRKWQKILSIFRGRESKREYKQMEKILNLGLKTAIPIFYTKDYLIYEFVKGTKPKESDLDLVIETLKKIHSLGYLHGDSHLDNFIIDEKNEIYIIDSKFQKNKYGKFGEMFELMYLEESVSRVIVFEKKNIYYEGASLLRKYLTFLSKLKNIIRRR
ncbi:MAG: lipopolysaccharide biosynthesis protein [Fusobacterium sp.]|nr:lipopolysaccharide biosynthesis protein [Fusobacterium sp.]